MKKFVILTLILITFITGVALASVPAMINYQGKLLEPTGQPKPDGQYQMTFAIYDVPSGGTALWSETNGSVVVKGGLFSVLLGSVVNLPANIFDSPNRWFGVKVGADSEMTPRQPLVSVPFAVKAERAASAATVDDGVITTDKIADGAITVSKLKPGEIGMIGYDEIISPVTIIYAPPGNHVYIPGLKVTASVPQKDIANDPQYKRRVKVTVMGRHFDTTSTGFIETAIFCNDKCISDWDRYVVAGQPNHLFQTCTYLLSPGSYEFNLSVQIRGGEFHLLAGEDEDAVSMLVELI